MAGRSMRNRTASGLCVTNGLRHLELLIVLFANSCRCRPPGRAPAPDVIKHAHQHHHANSRPMNSAVWACAGVASRRCLPPANRQSPDRMIHPRRAEPNRRRQHAVIKWRLATGRRTRCVVVGRELKAYRTSENPCAADWPCRTLPTSASPQSGTFQPSVGVPGSRSLHLDFIRLDF